MEVYNQLRAWFWCSNPYKDCAEHHKKFLVFRNGQISIIPNSKENLFKVMRSGFSSLIYTVTFNSTLTLLLMSEWSSLILDYFSSLCVDSYFWRIVFKFKLMFISDCPFCFGWEVCHCQWSNFFVVIVGIMVKGKKVFQSVLSWWFFRREGSTELTFFLHVSTNLPWKMWSWNLEENCLGTETPVFL